MKMIFKLKRDDFVTYNTKQKDLILNTIKKYNREFTVKEIYEEIKDTTGLTTIYRLVDKLVSEEVLSKIIKSDNITYYQYLGECHEKNHIYLKCDSCGKLTHVDCKCIKELTEHISKDHGFKTTDSHIIINGLCKSCKEV